MIYGIGLDMVEVGRVRSAIERRQTFLGRVFTPAEQAYCLAGERHRHRRLAARFAAKEAVLKALGIGLREVKWTDAEVLNDTLGKPQVRLYGQLAVLARQKGVTRVLISLSHSLEYAIAQAVAIKDTGEDETDAGGSQSPDAGNRDRGR